MQKIKRYQAVAVLFCTHQVAGEPRKTENAKKKRSLHPLGRVEQGAFTPRRAKKALCDKGFQDKR